MSTKIHFDGPPANDQSHPRSRETLTPSNVAATIAPDGVTIGMIRLPENCANVCFGGAKRNRLFMTASQSLYAVYVDTEGAGVA